MSAPASLAYRPFDRTTWRDPWPLYAWLRGNDPVHRSPDGFWVLSRFADVYDAARDPQTFSSASGLTFTNEVDALALLPTMVMMDPPRHTDFRRLVSRDFTSRAVAGLADAVRRFTRRLLPDLADGGDFVALLARRVPAYVVAHFLGVPESDLGRFEAWTESLVQASATGSFADASAALADLYGYFTDLVEWRRAAPGDDTISHLIAAGECDATHLLGFAFVMVAGGNDTATGLLAGAAELLTAAPDQRQRLIHDPGLLPGAVEELLRLTSPVQGLCRLVTRDAEVGGVRLGAGERVLLCYGAANRDPREFGPTAEDLQIDRPIRRILTFSSGPHYCLGAHAARLQGRIVLAELLAAYPEFMVDADAGVFADGAFTRRYESLPFTPR